MNFQFWVVSPGMILSDEPAVYVEGRYGIRTENVIQVVPYKETEYNTFYRFDMLTLVPIDTRAVDYGLLTPHEVQWLESYNKRVYDTLKDLLDDSERQWLLTCTK